MITTSATNQSACECCGREPQDRYSRNQTARDVGARYVRTRANRVRIDPTLWPYYADRLGDAFPAATWAGKLACPQCRARLYARINEG